MTSMLCVRQPGGSCGVANDRVVKQLVEEPENDYTQYVRKVDFLRRHQERSAASRKTASSRRSRVGGVDSDTLAQHSLKLQEWLNDKQVKNIQEKADTETKETRKIYDPVLDREDTFVKNVDEFLDYNKLLGDRKKEFLHKQWINNVFSPIRKEVNQEVNGPVYNDLDQRKRSLHKEYLEHVNRKGHVFLDVIAPDEYYPLGLHPVRPSLLVAETNKLQDPLLTQERARSAEDRVILRCSTGRTFTDKDIKTIRLPPLPLVPLGRHGTECNTWLEMPLRDIESSTRLASRQRMSAGRNHSDFSLADWSKTFDNSVVDKEMALQKRRKLPMEHMKSQIPQLYRTSTREASTQADLAE